MIAHVGSLASAFAEGGGVFAHPFSGVPVPISSPVSFGTNDAWQITHDPRRAYSPLPGGPIWKRPILPPGRPRVERG